MDITGPTRTQHAGQAALLYVLTNNGDRWGCLVLRDGTQLDVNPSRDIYDDDMSDAIAHLEECAKLGRVETSAGSYIDPGHDWIA